MENMMNMNTATENGGRTFEIPACNLAALEKKLTRVRNKCARYGCEFTYEKTGETVREVKDDDGKKYTVRYITLRTSGHAIINGWQFVASVEHTEKGNIINRVEDIEIPSRYYCGDPYCEHCRTRRARKDTYIVRNLETGDFKQVGKTCLYDYTHGLNAEFIAATEQWFHDLEDAQNYRGGGYAERMLDTREFLAYCAETIARFGYVRTQDAGESTRDRATSYYGVEHGWYSGLYAKEIREELTREMEKVGFNAHRPQNAEKVTAALDWLSRQDVSGNYMHNLTVATALEFTIISNAGILCSLFPTYDRELEREAERAERERELARKAEMEKVSDWQGEVGKRVEFKPVEARIVTSWVNSFNPYGGMVYIWKIKDGDGNIYTWKTSNVFRENNDGEVVLPETIKGTVKEHKTYREVKQTELTRCKLNY